MNRRNLLLKEMGITQWQLHRPDVLQGVVGIVVAENIRLIIVSDENVQTSPLLSDVLLSLEIPKEDCLCLNFEQIQHLESSHAVRYWLLAESAEKIDRALPFCLQAERIYRSPNFAQFQLSNAAKQDLWQQIQQI